MIKTAGKKYGLYLALVLLLIWPNPSAGQQAGKVAVFPFQIFSNEPLGYLSTSLQDMLRTRLEKDGVQVLDPGEVNRALEATGKPLDLTLARQIAGKMGADFAVFGSLTKIGSRVSLDTKVLDVLGIRRPQTVYVEGAGLEAVEGITNQISREVAVLVSGREMVADVKVEGNHRIEAEAIKAAIKSKPGGPYSPLRLDDDIREIWKMGYFDDVQVKVADSEKGKVVTFVVKEKPTVREVQIVGNNEIDVKDIRDQIGIKPFSVFKPALVKEGEQKIVRLYRDKGFYDVKVTDEIKKLPSGDMSVTYNINEGEKVYVKAIRFEGNKAFSESELRSQMSTNESGWLTWLTKSNVLERQTLEQDIQRLGDFYYNNGYMQAKISEPTVTREDNGLAVTIKVVEGPRYKVSDVSLNGDMILPREEAMTKLTTKPGEWYSRDAVRADMAYLTNLYADRGYAYVDVRPQIRQDAAKTTVSVAYEVKKGDKVYFEQIVITGNSRTRDKVIRRELGAAEGDLFSGEAIRQANSRLRRLDFFEDVHITTSKGSTEDKMNLKVDVKEKRTGQVSFGAGYSTEDSFMVMGSIAENNLFGRGQRVELRGQLGGKATRYTFSFTEPWLLDRPISAGFDLYDWEREYIDYDKESVGGRIRFGFPTPYDYTRVYLYYQLEEATISNVADDAALVIKDQVGSHTTSSVKSILRRDSRNHVFNATDGSDNSLSVEYAGDPLGGTNAFIKVIGDTGWYFPLFWDTVFVLHGRAGWLTSHSGGDLPMYEKFFLGGINTLRGFEYQSVSPRDPATGDRIGGERMAYANVEYRFPLLPKAGLLGVVFYDTGNVWTVDQGYDLGDLRQSIGAGIRWMSPVGPLRLEYGYVLDPLEDEDGSAWEFSVGSVF
ncbi:MAG: outer membrane protein assembly factor BamA [Deltaproteobacteria bacterium]|nr:outer membrane protein assembly factor BamA [Deltaproteobacteria bacterium]